MAQTANMKADESGGYSIKETSNAALLMNHFPEKVFYQYGRDRILFDEKEPITSIYCQVSGLTKATRIINKKIFTLSLAWPGQIFGLEAFSNHPAFSFSLITLENCVFCAIRKRDFLAAIRNDTSFAFQLMKMIQQEINRLENKLDQLQYHSVHSKIAALIVELNEKANDNSILGSFLDLNDLADLGRISESHLCRVLDEFRKKKYLDYAQNKITILNHEALKRESSAEF